MTTKFTKWPLNIPDDHKIYQMTFKYSRWPQNLPNDQKIGDLVYEIYHLATVQMIELSVAYKLTFCLLQKLCLLTFCPPKSFSKILSYV
jgi:hypothetical protein